MSLLITICGRGGSKAVPGKNIRMVAGLPLIAYSIRHAQSFAGRTGADVALSTDSDEIRCVAAEYGLKSGFIRPADLATDGAGKLPVIRHLLLHEEQARGKTYDYVLDLDITSPLRTQEDLQNAFALLQSNTRALNLFSVSFPAHNPYFDMVEMGEDGFARLCKKPKTAMLSRQQGPRVFELDNSFYFYRRAFFASENPELIGRTIVYEMPHMCFEIDTLRDMEFLEYLLKHDKMDFTFPH